MRLEKCDSKSGFIAPTSVTLSFRARRIRHSSASGSAESLDNSAIFIHCSLTGWLSLPRACCSASRYSIRRGVTSNVVLCTIKTEENVAKYWLTVEKPQKLIHIQTNVKNLPISSISLLRWVSCRVSNILKHSAEPIVPNGVLYRGRQPPANCWPSIGWQIEFNGTWR